MPASSSGRVSVSATDGVLVSLWSSVTWSSPVSSSTLSTCYIGLVHATVLLVSVYHRALYTSSTMRLMGTIA